VIEKFGIPEVISSDGGSQFTSQEFLEFCKSWFIAPRTSSPGYAQSNGIAENAVKEMKKLIRGNFRVSTGKLDESAKASILLFRNTPREPSGLSPAQMLFGRTLRDTIPFPCRKESMKPEWQTEVEKRVKEVNLHRQQMLETDERRELPPLSLGQKVFVQDPASKKWIRSGTVMRVGENSREYWVLDDDSGREFRRNRRLLRPKLVDVIDPPKQPVQAPKLEPKSSGYGQPAQRSSVEPAGGKPTPKTEERGARSLDKSPLFEPRPSRNPKPPSRFADESAKLEKERKEKERRGRKRIRKRGRPMQK